MKRTKEYRHKKLEAELDRLSGEASWFISHGHAMRDEGKEFAAMTDFAESAWREERLASLLDAVGREEEAAIHRISAASCYEKTGEDARAANLYRAALAGPLPDHTRRDVSAMLTRCLTRLIAAKPSSLRRARKGVMTLGDALSERFTTSAR